jgi:hypothetical protein
MLKKGQLVQFVNPMSTMHKVLNSVGRDKTHRRAIMEDTGLNDGQVRSALWNLTFIGAIKRGTDGQGRSVYRIPGAGMEVCAALKGINSIFSSRATR